MCLQIATESKTHFKTPITSHTCMEAHTCKHGQPTNAHTYTTQHNTTQHNTTQDNTHTTHTHSVTHTKTHEHEHTSKMFSHSPLPPKANRPWQCLWFLECWGRLPQAAVPCLWDRTRRTSAGASGWCPAPSRWPQCQSPVLCMPGTLGWQFHLQKKTTQISIHSLDKEQRMIRWTCWKQGKQRNIVVLSLVSQEKDVGGWCTMSSR